MTDPALVSFFDLYDNHWPQRLREAAVAPLLNKVSKFTANPLLRAHLRLPSTSSGYSLLTVNDTFAR